ncbi:MAG TPA: hypothetical protein H9896_07605 [Candidatus Pygmaiobacter gallistercoris]|nr:hypothetical protein [Candidatus Pygmaiobacter gallistercoris]
MEQLEMIFQNELIGALIALGRAAENESPDPETDRAMLEGLALTGQTAPEETLQAAILALRAAKDRLVPSCASCACPCGRTAEYPLRELLAESDRARTALRLALLSSLGALARLALAAGEQDSALLAHLYLSLFALGYPFEAERMQQLIADCGRYALELLSR